jgi:catechol 2,3-dioxygenase-like lactoylglutathione lyase family enzyme
MITPQPHPTVASLGPVFQLGFVPRDFDAALAFWTGTMGVGPFYYIEHLPLVGTRYRGQPTAIDSSVALAYWGDLQIELLRQHDSTPSVYTEWLDAGREGVQHFCIAVDDMAAACGLLRGLGGVAVHEAAMEGAAEAAYFELPGPGPMVEIARLAPQFDALFAFMRRTARQWDGSDPVRSVPPESAWTAG